MPNWCMAFEKARLSVPSMHEKTRSTPAFFIFCTSAVGDAPMPKLRSSNPRWKPKWVTPFAMSAQGCDEGPKL